MSVKFSLLYSGFTCNNGSLLENFTRSFQVEKELSLEGRLQLLKKQFRLNCSGHKDMNVTTSVLVDSETECSTELDVEEEPSISIF